METKLITINNINTPAAQAALYEAAELICDGKLVAFPTETVYGLGANALDSPACAAIFAAKGRPADNPLIVHIADMDMLNELVVPSPLAIKLINAFWPGPLTLVLPKKPTIPDIVSAGLPTLAVRWPSLPLATALIKAAHCPIAAPSANLSGRSSPTTAWHVYTDFAGKIPLILNGGPTEIGLESTVVDACGKIPQILRPGRVEEKELAKASDQPISYTNLSSAKRPTAPGMKYRHYAPKGEMLVAHGLSEIMHLRLQLKEKYHQEPLLMVWAETAAQLPGEAEVLIMGKEGDLTSYARNLFAALRKGDEQHFSSLIAEAVPEYGFGIAIMNRLNKAVSQKVLLKKEL
ncbi:MAG: L-threonylcarbamoyladenylate synthase [Firmicutes bacterium]|nr:L-threonylcarbamoyladenylate synthase [Bacillota bacterium]